MLEVSAEACSTAYSKSGGGEFDEENEEKNCHIRERAKRIKEEAMPEVKQINEWISKIKCQAIRDAQMQEKEKRLWELKN